MSYEAKVLADSLTPRNDRLITLQVRFPRFILAELNTHRMFSRNSASSRAIPPEKQIQRLLEEPFVPEAFHSRVKGMGQGDAIDDQLRAQEIWLAACNNAVQSAEDLMAMGISKAHVNRILEPFLWHTAIVTATEWENFFALRCPSGDEVDYDFPAQPEFQQLALRMRQVMRESEPQRLAIGEWHLPLVEPVEIVNHDDGHHDVQTFWAMVSAGRCARVSFETQGSEEDPNDSFDRAMRLLDNGHMSPMEHPATPGEVRGFYQNLWGWKSLRHITPHQENMIGYKESRGGWNER